MGSQLQGFFKGIYIYRALLKGFGADVRVAGVL